MTTVQNVSESLRRIVSRLRASLNSAGSRQFTKPWLSDRHLLRPHESVDTVCAELLHLGIVHIVPLVSKKTVYELVDDDGAVAYLYRVVEPKIMPTPDMEDDAFEALFSALERIVLIHEFMEWRTTDLVCRDRAFGLPDRQTELGPREEDKMPPARAYDDEVESEEYREGRRIVRRFCEEALRRNRIVLLEPDLFCLPAFEAVARKAKPTLEELTELFHVERTKVVDRRLIEGYPLFSDDDLMGLDLFSDKNQLEKYLSETQYLKPLGFETSGWYAVTEAYENSLTSTTEAYDSFPTRSMSRIECTRLVRAACLVLGSKLVTGFEIHELGFTSRVNQRLAEVATKMGVFFRLLGDSSQLCSPATFERFRSLAKRVDREDRKAADKAKVIDGQLVKVVDVPTPPTDALTESTPEEEAIPSEEFALIEEECLPVIEPLDLVLEELSVDGLFGAQEEEMLLESEMMQIEKQNYREIGKTLADLGQWRRCNGIEYILGIVAAYYHIDPDLLKGRQAEGDIARMRQVLFFLMNMCCHESQREIGAYIGGRTQTVVSKASWSLRARLREDEGLVREIADLRKLIRGE